MKLEMDGKKLIAICQFSGEFETDKDGTLSYHGGEAHAVDIDHQTKFDDFKSEVSEMLQCGIHMVSIKYFLPGNRRTLITISNEKDFKRMITFNANSVTVDVYLAVGEVVAHDLSNMPASRSSRTTLSEAPAPDTLAPVDSQIDNIVHTQHEEIVDAPEDVPVDSAPSVPLFLSHDAKNHNVPSSWVNAITGVSQRFRNVHEFREALRKYAIAHRFAFKYKKNDSHRVTVNCKSESCRWRLHASRLSTTQLFCIKKMNPTHTCEGGVVTTGSHATTNWVASIVKEKLRDSPSYKPKDIVNDIKQEFGVELNYYQAWRGREIAKEELRGSYREAYSQLPLLCEKIMETNPGSFATFATKEDSSFHRLFISFHASLNGFQLGCRPLLFLESFPLKSKYQVSLLVATAADGNDGVFPVAFAVTDDESVYNWHWFLVQLKSAISTSRPITFVADLDKGLKESIAEVFENGYHGYCLQHLTEYFKRDLPTHFSNEVKRLLVADFYAAAYALKFEEFQRCTESIKGISSEAFNWIVQSKPEHWANAFFGGARYNHMSSNFGQVFYSWVSEASELPITQLVHMIQAKIMELIYTRLDSGQWLTTLTPCMEEKLQKEILKADSLQLEALFLPGTDNIFDVRGGSIEKVDVDQWICSCKAWQITGLPCCHAIAVFKSIDRSPYDYCSKYFTSETFRLTYSNSLNPVPNVDNPMNKESSQAVVVVTPPPTRRAPGRPKINRNASQGLDKRTLQCSKCKAIGHNKLTCKEVI